MADEEKNETTEAEEPQAEEPAPRTRTAATPPAARSAPETTANAAGYVVQLSSQKTEAEAHAVRDAAAAAHRAGG